MTQLINAESSAHWYMADGTPCYEIKGKNGKMRSPYKREAKALGLVPSVTSILRVVAKPQLEAWKQTQCVLSALTLPRIEGETLDQFARRVVEDAGKQSSDAADLGTRVHHGCENYVVEGIIPCDETAEAVKAFASWWEGWKLIDAEKPVAVNNGICYGGRIDIIAEPTNVKMSCVLAHRAVLDIKTQGKGQDKLAAYDDWAVQLAAYAKAVGATRRINIVLSTVEPGAMLVHEWPEDTMDKDFAAFKAAYDLWCWQNKWNEEN